MKTELKFATLMFTLNSDEKQTMKVLSLSMLCVCVHHKNFFIHANIVITACLHYDYSLDFGSLGNHTYLSHPISVCS